MGWTRVGRAPRLVATIALVCAWVLASAPIAAAGNATGINVTLPVGGKYTGKVVDAKTGLGIAGVRIRVEPTDGRGVWNDTEFKTDANGAYTVFGLFIGVTHGVRFEVDDGLHLSGCWSGNAARFVAEFECDLTPAPKPVAAGTSLGTTKLPRGVTVSGVVRGGTATSNVPLAGVAVRSCGGDAITAADGSWSIGGVPPGSCSIEFDAPATRNYRDGSYKPNASGTNWAADYSSITVGSAGLTANVILPTGRTVTGYVKDSSGTPIVGATVKIGEEDPAYMGYDVVRTDSSGKFVYKGLAPGTANLVWIERPAGRNLMNGYYRGGATGNFTWDSAQASPVSISTSNVTLPDIRVWTGYTITGRVMMPDGITPAKGAWVGDYGPMTVSGVPGYANASGNFTIVGLAPGPRKPYVASPVATAVGGWFDAATPIYHLTMNASAGDSKTLNATTKTWNIGTVRLLSAAASISISGLIKGGSTGLAQAEVYAWDYPDGYGAASTASTGTYKVTGLSAGSYGIEVRPPAGKNFVGGYYRSGVAGNWTRDYGLATRVTVGP